MKPTIEEIKAACREAIRLGEEATKGPWKSKKSIHGSSYRFVQIGDDESYTTLEMYPQDSRFISHARTFSPLAAKGMLELIDYVEEDLR